MVYTEINFFFRIETNFVNFKEGVGNNRIKKERKNKAYKTWVKNSFCKRDARMLS